MIDQQSFNQGREAPACGFFEGGVTLCLGLHCAFCDGYNAAVKSAREAGIREAKTAIVQYAINQEYKKQQIILAAIPAISALLNQPPEGEQKGESDQALREEGK